MKDYTQLPKHSSDAQASHYSTKTEPQTVPVYPANLDDKVAQKTQWTALGQHGKPLTPEKQSSSHLVFTPNAKSFAQMIAPTILFVAFVVLFCVFLYSQPLAWLWISLTVIIGSLVVCKMTLFPMVEVRGFDTQHGIFYTKTKYRDEYIKQKKPFKESTHCFKLSRIYAIQVIEKPYVEAMDIHPTWHLYEMNLVLSNGHRFNIGIYDNYKSIKRHALKLSNFLGVELWDTMQELPQLLNKPAARNYYRKKLQSLDSEAKATSSKKLVQHLRYYLEANPKIKTVGLFAGTKTEPYLLPLLETLFVERLAPQFYLPKITDTEQRLMQFEQVTKQRELVKGAFDILEPTSGVVAKHLDLILVPGLAFTKDGGRLGQGGGYYDRYLDKYPYISTLGVGFHCQFADYLSIDTHDIILDSVLLK